MAYRLTPERLFNRIRMNIRSSDSIAVRVLKDIDVTITSTQQDYGNYHQNLSPWEGMIEYPISGIENAFGFFFTKTKGELHGLHLDRRSLNSLCESPKWKDLKFRHW